MDHIKEAEMNYEEWMSCLPEKLWDVPLTNLSIPGSHDAMSFCLDITSPLLRSESDTFRLLDGVFCCFTRPAIYRWATTQAGIYLIFYCRISVSPIARTASVYLMCKGRIFFNTRNVFVICQNQSPLLCCKQVQNIVEQLTAGIRYFDLRIAHKQNDSSNELYFTHVIYTRATVIKTLQTVASWLESHTKEIIILACSHFEGLDYKAHEEFIYSLKKIFGSKLCPRNEVPLTLRSLWTSGYQVVLSYEDQSAARHVELWPAIPYLWANKPNAEELIQYLEWQKQLGRPEGFFVAGLNLTADRCFIASHPRKSLQTLTMENWMSVMKWVEDQKPGAEPTSLNIIAGDFIGPIPLCSLIIALNEKLL